MAVVAALPTILVTPVYFTCSSIAADDQLYRVFVVIYGSPQLHPWILLCGLALIWGALAGVLRAAWAGTSVARALLAWALTLTSMWTIPANWPHIYPFWRLLYVQSVEPARVLAVALQLATFCASLDVAVQALSLLARHPLTRRRLWRGACIGAGMCGLYAIMVVCVTLVSNPDPLINAGNGVFEVGLIHATRTLLTGFGLAGGLVGLLATSLTCRPGDAKKMADGILLAALLWIGAEAAACTVGTRWLYEFPPSIYLLALAPGDYGYAYLRATMLGLAMALVFMCVAALTRTIESGETSCVDSERQGTR